MLSNTSRPVCFVARFRRDFLVAISNGIPMLEAMVHFFGGVTVMLSLASDDVNLSETGVLMWESSEEYLFVPISNYPTEWGSSES